MMRVGGSSSSSSSPAPSRCQECGNQAKRDCEYMRCRTCCKNRGFQCATHINSTWIPLSLRRPRQYYFHNPFNLSAASSNHQGIETCDFPAEMNTSATFRCVRMMSENMGVDQCAYEATVEIGGHIFKGLLYDQGPMQEGDDEQENNEDPNHGCYTTAGGIGHVHTNSSLFHQQLIQHESISNPNPNPNPNPNIASAFTVPPVPPAATNCDIVLSSPYPCPPFYPFMPGMLYFPFPRP